MVRARKYLISALVITGVAALGTVIVWNQREPIARSALDAFLRERGVQASYEIAAIGTRRQRLENVRIGDPRNPDLTAEWVEIDMGPSLSGLSARAVRAKGVRLRGRIVEGWLSMGSVDKLLPAPSGEPFTLPNIDLALEDARMQLGSPYGKIGLRLDGRGNLSDGFSGQLAAVAPTIRSGNCAATDSTAFGALTSKDGRARFDGPIRVAAVDCSGIKANAVVVDLDASMAPKFDGWSGTIDARSERISGPGIAANAMKGHAAFDGKDALTRAETNLTLIGASTDGVTAGQASLAGLVDIGSDAQGALLVSSNGSLIGEAVRPVGQILSQIEMLGAAGSGTPIEPFAKALAQTLGGVRQGLAIRGRYALDQRNGRGSLVLSRLSASAPNGVRALWQGEESIRLNWPGGLTLSGGAELSGGGLPRAVFRFGGEEGAIAGEAVVAPWPLQGARLSLSPVRFAQVSNGWRVDSVATLDGPLGTGRVTGLKVPLALRPGMAPLAGCQPIGFRSLSISGLSLSPASLRTCIDAKGARIAQPRLAGRLGGNPIGLAATMVQLGFARGEFSASDLAVRLGGGSEYSRLDIDRLAGSFQKAGAGGTYSGLSGALANVPLLASDGNGRWALQNNRLSVNGGLQIADAAAEPRFNPLIANDFDLRLINGIVTANATAREPKSGAAVTNVSIRHALDSGRGEAVLDVPDLVFGNPLQPDTLTPITLGVIANVTGRVTGRGTINWSPDGVTSSGGFRTEGLNFAAAFGPVTGLKGEIALSDLLGLETPAGQRVSIGSINPGIAVLDGEVEYRLLPGQRVQVQGGRWPFAGGTLILETTTLDLSAEAERRLTFRVEGLDAANFINQMEFENFAATGTFDGVLPMIFDKDGGRIEKGLLVARGAGTLSYIGEISNEMMPVMAMVAFDALKSMRFESMTIGLEGPLDGDVVTKIGFKGVNQLPVAGKRRRLPIPIQITGLDGFPFVFNITITAPFRRLFRMAQTIQDPSLLIEQLQPGLERVGPATSLPPAEKPVQTPESRK